MRLPVGLDASHVLPVRLVVARKHVGREVVGHELVRAEEARQYVAAEVVLAVLALAVGEDGLFERLALKDVVAHRNVAEAGASGDLRRNGGFLDEIYDASRLVGGDASELARLGGGDDVRGDGYVGVVVHVIREHLFDVHLVDVVRREDAHAVGVEERHEMHVLEYRVGRALVPALAVPHLGRHYVDEEVSAAKSVAELPALAYVLMERLAFELDEAID